MKDIMLDLETMGTSHDAAIIQIGACYFDRNTGEIGEEFLVNVDLKNEMERGFLVDASTIGFWMIQSDEARYSVMDADNVAQSLTALQDFNDFAKGVKHVWSHATFDFVILMNHLKKLKITPSIHYRGARDIRTLVDLAKIDLKQFKRAGIHHNALDDCKFQIQYVVECFNKLKLASVIIASGQLKGETCHRYGCQGIIDEHERGSCTCHTGSPPCSNCTRALEYCPICGWEARDE
jgi:hypothetical protein